MMAVVGGVEDQRTVEGETKTALGPTRWPKGYREVLVEFAPLLSTPTEPRRPASVFKSSTACRAPGGWPRRSPPARQDQAVVGSKIAIARAAVLQILLDDRLPRWALKLPTEAIRGAP